jgi:hypothetical protein
VPAEPAPRAPAPFAQPSVQQNTQQPGSDAARGIDDAGQSGEASDRAGTGAAATPTARQVKVCTMLDCLLKPQLSFKLPDSFDEIRRLSMTLCRNETCLTGPLTDSVTPPSKDNPVMVRFPDMTERPMVVSTVAVEERGYRAGLIWAPRSTDDFKDGDVYRLTVVDDKQRKLMRVKRAVKYAVSYPNGPTCGPTCKQFVIDLQWGEKR